MTIKTVRLCVSLLLTLFLIACARSPEAKRDKALERARHLMEKKDYQRALLECKNAIKATPRDAEAFYNLGLAYVGARDLQSAFQSFNAALSLNPKHAGAKLQIGRIMSSSVDQNILSDAETRLEALVQDTPHDPEALNALSLTRLKLGKIVLAIDQLQKTLAMAPQNLNSSVLLAQAKVKQGDFKGAEDVLMKACQSAPTSPDARVLLGQLYLSQHRYAEAEREFQAALKMESNHASALVAISGLYDTLDRKAEAEQALKRLSSSSDSSVNAFYAMFLFREGHKDEAVREFERLAKTAPDDRAARSRLIAGYFSVGRQQDGERILNETLKKNGKDLDALLQRSELAALQGNFAQAEVDLNRVLHSQPTSAEAHYILAKLHQKRGGILLARQELSETLRLNSFIFPARLDLARLLLASKAFKAALETLDSAPNPQKASLPFIVERNWVLWAAGDMNQFRRGIDSGLSRARTPDLLIQDGLWKLHSGKFSDARTSLEEALKINPEDLRALEALRRSYAAQKQRPLAVQTVKEYAARMPKSAPVQQFLGNVLLAAGDSAAAREAFSLAKGSDPTFQPAQISLIQLDAAENKWGSVKERLNQTLKTDPGNPKLRCWLGDVESLTGNPDGAIKIYRQILAADPLQAQALNNLAFLTVDYANRPDEALPYAEKAVEMAPADPDYSDTLGWVLYRKGLYGRAVKHFEAAATHGGNIVWKYHLAMAYEKTGQKKQAMATLQSALKSNPRVPEAKTASDLILGAK